jgi:alanine dehydrogenase
MAVCAVRKITRIRCFSPKAEHCRAFSESVSTALGIPVEPVGQPEDAINGADIVMCATNSIDNIFFARWIESGMHVSSIKLPEIEYAAIQRADRLVIHTRDANPLHVVSKELAVPERAENKGWKLGEAIDFKNATTLADLITGTAEARSSDREVTCFINNLGMGYQFAAAGAVVYRKAKESGLGYNLPTDWFTQDVHP